MNVTIIDVGAEQELKSKAGKAYQSIEITYKNDEGKVANKKLMSFGNAEVYKAMRGAKKGDVIGVVSTKDDAGYWQWTGLGEATSSATSSSTSSSKSSSGGTYETREERQARQVLIVKQSCLAQAVATLKVDTKALAEKDVIKVAEGYVEWVMGEVETE